MYIDIYHFKLTSMQSVCLLQLQLHGNMKEHATKAMLTFLEMLV